MTLGDKHCFTPISFIKPTKQGLSLTNKQITKWKNE